jgi:hypothetical protein
VWPLMGLLCLSLLAPVLALVGMPLLERFRARAG